MTKQGIIRLALLILVFSVIVGCVTMSPSRPGTVKLVNKTEGAYGYCVLFRGNYWSKDDLLTLDPATGGLMWAISPALKFRIESAHTREIWNMLRLDLIPNTKYTLYIFWTRFYGRELGESVVRFRTYINPRRRCHVDKLGIRTCASEIVYLPQVNTSTAGRFRIHKTFYAAQAIKDLLGMP